MQNLRRGQYELGVDARVHRRVAVRASEHVVSESRRDQFSAWGFQMGSAPGHFVLRYSRVEIHRSARRHRVRDADIRHAVEHAIVVVDLDPEADPPRVLAIGPDRAGNLLEVIVLELADDRLLAIHAMPLRPAFYDLLPQGDDDDG